MSKGIKIIGIIAVLVLILGVIAWGFWRWFTHRAFPKTSGTVQVQGVENPVEIIRDQYGVAHIYAQSAEDLFFGQGYVHAQERFWQMEFQRRLAAGRLSEIFGETTLGTDKYIRNFGFWDLTEQSYSMLDAETKNIVDAYTTGVNAYIKDRTPTELGLEFAMLGLQGVDYVVEPWSGVDSLIWGEMMIFDQSDQLSTELHNIKQLAEVGWDMYADLHPAYRDDRPVIITEAKQTGNACPHCTTVTTLESGNPVFLEEIYERISTDISLPPLLVELGFQAGAGSNSFAIAGEKTTTGKPLLANDPHMGVNLPALWYEIGMQCVEKSPKCLYNFRGFSLPGVPGILIGHNDRVAWGLTNASFDAEDVFIERINPQNPNQYEVNGEWEDMEIRREEIYVRGSDEPEVLFVRRTRNGLVASDTMVEQTLFSGDAQGPQVYALAYAWTALEPVQSVKAVLLVNKAQNWDEFLEVLQYFDAGKQNWLYADVEGNIGYIMPGKVPIRAGGDGSLPVPGWNDDYIWTGFIPHEQMPMVLNPSKAYIATANNPQFRAGEYPYLLSVDHDRGQRAQRINDMILSTQGGISIDDMVAIQTDNMDLSALEVIPYLQDLPIEDAGVSAARDQLLQWDAQMKMDSPEAALFNLFWVQLLDRTFHDQLPTDLRPNGDHVTSDTLYFLLQEPQNEWWDDITTGNQIEDRDQILEQAFAEAYLNGVELFGNDLDEWRWGDLHTVTFRNATLGSCGIGLIESIFNRGPYAVHGSESVIQKTCWDATNPYEVVCIPALRQVIDLGDLRNTIMIHSVGQSGHPMHRYYDHFIDAWRNFEYHPSNWLREDAEKGDHELLVLEPAG